MTNPSRALVWLLVAGCGSSPHAEGDGAVVWTYVEVSPVDGFIAANDVAVADDGTVLVAGEIALEEELEPRERENRELLVRKLSSGGASMWPIADVDDRPEVPDRAVAVAPTADGGALLTGRFGATIRAYTGDGAESWELSLLDEDGEMGFPYDDGEVRRGQALAPLADGTYLVAAGFPWLQRIDASGEIVGEPARDPGTSPSEVTALAIAEHRVIAAGSYTHPVDGPTIWVGAFTTSPDPIWIVDEARGHLDAVAAIGDDVLVASHEVAADEDEDSDRWRDRLEAGFGGQGWLRRRSGRDGALLWERPLDDSRGQRVRDLVATDTDELIAVGDYSVPYVQAWIAALDGDGETLWSEEVELERDGLSQARAAALGQDGRLFVAGVATDVAGYHRLWVQARDLPVARALGR